MVRFGPHYPVCETCAISIEDTELVATRSTYFALYSRTYAEISLVGSTRVCNGKCCLHILRHLEQSSVTATVDEIDEGTCRLSKKRVN